MSRKCLVICCDFWNYFAWPKEWELRSTHFELYTNKKFHFFPSNFVNCTPLAALFREGTQKIRILKFYTVYKSGISEVCNIISIFQILSKEQQSHPEQIKIFWSIILFVFIAHWLYNTLVWLFSFFFLFFPPKLCSYHLPFSLINEVSDC